MKVLMLSWEYPPHSVGGLGKHVLELVPALARAGIEVHLLTPRRAGGLAREVVYSAGASGSASAKVVVYRVDVPPSDNLSFFAGAIQANAALQRQAEELWQEIGPFDLIHAHDWLVEFAGVALKHLYKVPLLATIHATEFGRSRGTIVGQMPRAINDVEWLLTYEAWRVICCSQYMAREVESALGAPPDKIDVIPNGVDTSRFDALDGVDLSTFRLGFAAADEAIIFYVGRVVYEKGVHLLVQAMPRILAARPKTKLVVAGTGDSLNSARALAFNLGVGASCYFTGFIPDDVRDRLFRVADVAAFPSLYEPFGIVALEAMAAHAPVVAASVGGMAEVLRHRENAITVYPNSVDSLVWGVLEVLNRPEEARRATEVAYRMVRDLYNWDAIAQQTAAVYETIVAERLLVSWV